MASFDNEDTSFHDKWADLEPVPQDDGPNPVVPILYSKNFTKLMDLFRAVLRSQEKSQRVLDLTTDLLSINPANYTIWKYRRDCLKAINYDLNLEMDYMDKFAEDNPKNYQIWYHRRVIVELLGCSEREIPFCSKVFEVDSKNYHAWAHRQWVVKTYKLYEGELEYTCKLIESDPYNNSAWNHRWFIIHSDLTQPISKEFLDSEIHFVFTYIQNYPNNESSWNYLNGLRKKYDSVRQNIEDRCFSFKKNLEDKSHTCNFLSSTLIDILEEKEIYSEAVNMIESMTITDKLRSKYWTRRAEALRIRKDF